MAADRTDLRAAAIEFIPGDREIYRFPENSQVASFSLTLGNIANDRMPEDTYVSACSIELKIAEPTQIRRRRLIL